MTHVTNNPPAGTPTWLDLGIPDIERAKVFYGTLFGWEFQDYGAEAAHYHACTLGGRQVAGMMQHPDPSATDFWWNLYLATDDCDGTVKRVVDAHGVVIDAPMDVMDQGRMSIVRDPAGGQFGLWEGRAHIGFEVVTDPGSIAWVELVTPDGPATRDFYASVFDYRLEPMPESGMDYTVLHRAEDDQPIGGIYATSEATATSWVTYFEVEDTDVAIGQLTDLGGTVVEEAQDTPYGRLAAVEDPFGVRFRVIKSAPFRAG
jgi:uncharacterized protein